MNSVSGVGVLDKAMAVLGSLEEGPASLAEVVAATGLSRATAHRLVVALEAHGMARRNGEGRVSLGLRLVGLGHAAAEAIPGWLDARPELAWLGEQTGESVQLFVRDGDERVCVESLEAPHELRTIVPVGARLPLSHGSGGKALRAPACPSRSAGEPGAAGRSGTARPGRAGDAAGGGDADGVDGADGADGADGEGDEPWYESVEERQAGVASVSAPVRAPGGRVVAAVSVSGPIERITRRPGDRYGRSVAEAADRISSRMGQARG